MVEAMTSLMLAYISVQFLVICMVPIAQKIGLVEYPGGRKKHVGLIPLVGGISIYLGILLTDFLLGLYSPALLPIFLVCGGMVLMGSLDDRYSLSALLRLCMQVLAASVLVFWLHVPIKNLGPLPGLGVTEFGVFGYFFAIILLVMLTNAINMLDGIDGLVGSLMALGFLALGSCFGAANQFALAVFCWSVVGAVAAFLIFNLWGDNQKPLRKIFMGDAGSMFLGLCMGALLLEGSQGNTPVFNGATLIWFVLFPLTDMLTTLYGRMLRGRSPLRPDRTHIHHCLQQAGLSKNQTLAIVFANQAGFICIGLYQSLAGYPQWLSLVAAVLLMLVYTSLRRKVCVYLRWYIRSSPLPWWLLGSVK